MQTTFSTDGAVRLAHLGVVRASGADAATFLQGQLSNDVASLEPGQARLAGFCSAKGRLQASFVVWRDTRGTTGDTGGDLLLACAASVLPATLKRLSMFVLRAKVGLTDASADLPLWGWAGASLPAAAGAAPAWRSVESAGATLVRLPDAAGTARAWWIGAEPAAAPDAPALPLATWRWLEVRSGLPTIEADTVDRFVPQMINYELVGGVDFRKGCYPGQEVVARSQYRGTLKRRAFLFELDADDAPVAAGQEVFHSADAEQPAGRVVNAAAHPADGAASALVEVKLAALESGTLHLGRPGGPVLRRVELPYAVPLEQTV